MEAIRIKEKQKQTPWMNMNLVTDPEEKLEEFIKEERIDSNHPSSQKISESG